MYIVVFGDEFGNTSHVHTPIEANSYEDARLICKEDRDAAGSYLDWIDRGLFTRIFPVAKEEEDITA